ncbi:MAG TPA: hypothetical protein V6D47_06515, partial [Oscillatoriaceae cyanobacterium]
TQAVAALEAPDADAYLSLAQRLVSQGDASRLLAAFLSVHPEVAGQLQGAPREERGGRGRNRRSRGGRNRYEAESAAEPITEAPEAPEAPTLVASAPRAIEPEPQIEAEPVAKPTRARRTRKPAEPVAEAPAPVEAPAEEAPKRRRAPRAKKEATAT